MKFIILADEEAEKLWPVSRELFPYQLIQQENGDSLLQSAYKLGKELASENDILTVVSKKLKYETEIQLKNICENFNLLIEPLVKNRFVSILSAVTFLKEESDETVLIFPTGIEITDIKTFKSVITKAKKSASKGKIVNISLKDSVNSQIYVFKISALMNIMDELMPEYTTYFTKEMFEDNQVKEFEDYNKLKDISLDELLKSAGKKFINIELNSGYKKYSSWLDIYNNEKKDKNKNYIQADTLIDDVTETMILGDTSFIEISKSDNIAVIETDDCVLVCDKSKSDKVSKIVEELKTSARKLIEKRNKVKKPWGDYKGIKNGKNWLTKMLTIETNGKLSSQSHKYRNEHWIVTQGTATVTLNDEIFDLNAGQTIDIPKEAKHSIENKNNLPLKIIEVQFGEYIDENDIIRYEDIYNRIN